MVPVTCACGSFPVRRRRVPDRCTLGTNPRKGCEIAGALDWFRADVDNPVTGEGPFGRIRIWPLMGGVTYTVGEQPVLVSFSVVAGPSFNSFDFKDEFLRRLPPGSQPDADIKTSFGVMPGVGVTWTVAPRVAIVGFGGYMWNEPAVVYTDQNGQVFQDRWKASAVVLTIGAVYSFF